jgi:WD40 repeat protein
MQLTKHWAAVLDDYAIDLAWSPDGRSLAAASASGPLSIFDAASGATRHLLPGHADGTNALAWSPDGATLASGGQDGAVRFWDPEAGQHTATAELGSGWVEHLAWQPSHSPATLAAAAGRRVVFLGPDGTVRLRADPAPKTLTALAWSPDGALLASAGFGGVQVRPPDRTDPSQVFPYANGIHALAWSPDGRWLVSGNQDPSVHLWLPAKDMEFHMSGYEGKVRELSFDASGRWLATGGGRDACIWDCEGPGPEGREPTMLPHDAKVCAVAYQRRSSLLATGSEDGTLMLWSPQRQQPVRATVRMPAAATRLAWSPDDTLLAVGSAKGSVYVLRCRD